ncbi:uncharacterized protein J3D65DRAFT_138969 [Phyllosticta citribraziliensis]|uniref:Uncharacterized protein n=1 Tax=Phyllosticta citribraziliensis TaxID=989973 RepID=A0ABR1L884_9PEZI
MCLVAGLLLWALRRLWREPGGFARAISRSEVVSSLHSFRASEVLRHLRKDGGRVFKYLTLDWTDVLVPKASRPALSNSIFPWQVYHAAWQSTRLLFLELLLGRLRHNHTPITAQSQFQAGANDCLLRPKERHNPPSIHGTNHPPPSRCQGKRAAPGQHASPPDRRPPHPKDVPRLVLPARELARGKRFLDTLPQSTHGLQLRRARPHGAALPRRDGQSQAPGQERCGGARGGRGWCGCWRA